VSPYNSEQIKLSMMQLCHLDIIYCAFSSDLHKILKFDVEFLKALLFINREFLSYWGTAVAQWLRYCATNQKVAGLIPDGVIGIFH
jgi:hypothetical protein